MQVENERKKGKIKRLEIGGLLVVLFLLLYVPSFIHWIYGRTIDTELIRIGIIEDSVNTDAFLVRDEELLMAPLSGICIPQIKEGEKIPANFSVATVLKKSAQKLNNEIMELDLKILEVQKKKSETQELFSNDAAIIESEIGQKLNGVIAESNKNSLSKIRQIKEEVDKLIQKKATIIGSLSTPDIYLNSLKTQKQNLQAQIDANKGDIISKSPGIISYVFDGYETELNMNAISEIIPKYLDGIKPKYKISSDVNREIEMNKPFAKVIKGFECYLVVALDSKNAQPFKVGANIKVRINDVSKLVSGSIDYKSEEIDGKNIVAVKIDEGISETAGLRKINVDLIKDSYEGLKVPLTSLTALEPDKAKIVLVKANYASIRDVKILGKNNEYAVVDGFDKTGKNSINLYDTFVIEPKNIQEGQVINK